MKRLPPVAIHFTSEHFAASKSPPAWLTDGSTRDHPNATTGVPVNDLSADIAAQAVEPISVTADGQSTTGRSVADLIKADQYLALKAAKAAGATGMTFKRVVTPGAMAGGGQWCGGFDTFGGGFC